MQITFVGGLTVAWIGTYIQRVMNKDMTYVKQLKDYEDAVMAKRLEELPEVRPPAIRPPRHRHRHAFWTLAVRLVQPVSRPGPKAPVSSVSSLLYHSVYDLPFVRTSHFCVGTCSADILRVLTDFLRPLRKVFLEKPLLIWDFQRIFRSFNGFLPGTPPASPPVLFSTRSRAS